MQARTFLRTVVTASLALAMIAGEVRTARAAGVEPAKASPVQREQAQSRFLKGRSLYNAKKYQDALAELTASLDIVASPNTRLYVGRCLRDMGRLVAAYVELGRAEVEAKELQRDDARYEKAGEAALLERRELAPKLGFLDVRIAHASPSTTLTVSGDEVRRGGWDEPVPVAPGAATVVVATPGKAPISRTVKIAPGARDAVEIDAGADVETALAEPVATAPVEPASSPPHRLRPYAFATAGVAVAGLATFIVAGALANGTHSDLERACGAGPCPPGHEDDISAGRTQQTIANVGLAVFAVAGAASVTLFVVSRPSKTTAAASARVTAGPSFLGLQGAF